MLKYQLLHPRILEVVASAGHGSKILIADGNYPASTTLGPNADLVSLNLSPGIVSCAQVLAALVSAVPIEAVQVMEPERQGPYALQGEPPVWAEYRKILREAGLELPLQPIGRWEFYQAVATPELALTIQTADQNLYANLLLTIGVRKAE